MSLANFNEDGSHKVHFRGLDLVVQPGETLGEAYWKAQSQAQFANSDSDGRWVTVEGRHVFIKGGESLGSAFKDKTGHSIASGPDGKSAGKDSSSSEPATDHHLNKLLDAHANAGTAYHSGTGKLAPKTEAGDAIAKHLGVDPEHPAMAQALRDHALMAHLAATAPKTASDASKKGMEDAVNKRGKNISKAASAIKAGKAAPTATSKASGHEMAPHEQARAKADDAEKDLQDAMENDDPKSVIAYHAARAQHYGKIADKAEAAHKATRS